MSGAVRVTLDRVQLQALFDLAVESMDFASGFWETADVEVAREIAVILGVDPLLATPSNHMGSYPHPFRVRHGDASLTARLRGTCGACGAHADAEVHP